MISFSDCPRTSSMTMKGMPSSSPTSWTSMMFGCESEAAARASRSKRARNAGSAANCGRGVLIATSRPEEEVVPVVDDRHPAVAEAATDTIATLDQCLRLDHHARICRPVDAGFPIRESIDQIIAAPAVPARPRSRVIARVLTRQWMAPA